MLICLLVPTLIYALAVREPAPRWRAAYYANEGLQGQAVVRRERDVNHRWRGRSPLEGIPGEGFSVRWDSCLSLEHAQSVAFQLSSDDGARLFIDGRPVVDNWGEHPLRTRGTDVPLQAGVHQLRVEYNQLTNGSAVVLAASFDDERPQRIAPERLRFPTGDRERPCLEPLP